MKYFDCREAAKKAGISSRDLARMRELFKRDYPRDEMLRELHVLRACMAVRDKLVTVEEILKTHVLGNA